MNATADQEEWMIRTILAVRERETRDRLSAEAVSLAGLKYDRDRVAEFRQRFRMATTKESLMASVVGEDLVAETARGYVRALIASQIAGPVDTTWLDSIEDPAILERIFQSLLAARDEHAARAVLASYAR